MDIIDVYIKFFLFNWEYRNSRIPSADSIPQQVDASIRESASTTALGNHTGQQMSRQTLQVETL